MLQEDKTRMVIRKVIQEREAPLDPSISYPCLKAHVIKTNSVESSGAAETRKGDGRVEEEPFQECKSTHYELDCVRSLWRRKSAQVDSQSLIGLLGQVIVRPQ